MVVVDGLDVIDPTLHPAVVAHGDGLGGHAKSRRGLPDGNSLGVLPRATVQRVARTVTEEWGQGLVGSWNSAGWSDLPRRLGDKIAALIGAGPGEVVATDSSSINLYKVLSAALHQAQRENPERRMVLSERDNFPTDLYIAQALCREHGLRLRLVNGPQVPSALSREVAVVMLTHVN